MIRARPTRAATGPAKPSARARWGWTALALAVALGALWLIAGRLSPATPSTPAAVLPRRDRALHSRSALPSHVRRRASGGGVRGPREQPRRRRPGGGGGGAGDRDRSPRIQGRAALRDARRAARALHEPARARGGGVLGGDRPGAAQERREHPALRGRLRDHAGQGDAERRLQGPRADDGGGRGLDSRPRVLRRPDLLREHGRGDGGRRAGEAALPPDDRHGAPARHAGDGGEHARGVRRAAAGDPPHRSHRGHRGRGASTPSARRST